ncbi:MAG: rlmE [Gammaproteobacteria bacterium]|jgi:23S rRNA (uridine2552-2'-O)-methyltransferase|nr:rlmE [Gammaproteobacteria bacterium]
MSNQSSSSRRWLHEHFSDYYVKQAQKEGLRSRAVYKLKELQERDKLFRPGMTVVDLGAAPGGWSELVVKLVGKNGRVIALDVLPLVPIAGVEFIQGDFSESILQQTLMNQLKATPVDWVISDMAPNLSGITSVDMPRMIELAELALGFALSVLHGQGGFLVKMFQGEGFDPFLREVRCHFKKVVIRKPKASRGRSNELYVLAKN